MEHVERADTNREGNAAMKIVCEKCGNIHWVAGEFHQNMKALGITYNCLECGEPLPEKMSNDPPDNRTDNSADGG